MRKQLFSFLIAVVSMILLPFSMQAARVTFKPVNNGADITAYNEVSIYYQGIQIGSGSTDEHGRDQYFFEGYYAKIELDDKYIGQTVGYKTSMGHQGEFSVSEGALVTLECCKLTITAKNDKGEALSDERIYFRNSSRKTDENGQVVFYTVPGNYSWSWNYGNGYVDVQGDQQLDLVATIQTVVEVKKYRVSIIGRYGNFPVGDYSDEWYLYDGKSYHSYSVVAGTYKFYDRYGGYGGEFDINSDTIIYVDYHKLTISSKNSISANVGQKIEVMLSDDVDYYVRRASATTTNGKGEAELYLLPGTYRYSVAGGSGEFSMGTEDASLNIETVLLTFKIACDNMSAVSFYINNNQVAPSADGSIAYGCMPGAEVSLRVKSYNARTSMTVVADVSKTIDVPIYSLTINSQESSKYIEDGITNTETGEYTEVKLNSPTYLIAGSYQYEDQIINLNSNRVLNRPEAHVQLTIKDTAGNPVKSWVKFGDESENTNSAGKVDFFVTKGKSYRVYLETNDGKLGNDPDYTEPWTFVQVDGDMSETIVVPTVVSFTLYGKPSKNTNISNGNHDGDYYIDLYNNRQDFGVNGDQSDAEYFSTITGEEVYTFTNIRLFEDEYYSVSGVSGKVKITDGCTISFGSLSISSEGMGLAFPTEHWDAVSTYNVFIGNTVRLTAVPVSDDKFQKWIINGKEYTDPVIDLKLTESVTNAKAVFGGGSESSIRNVQMPESSISFDDSYAYLPSDIEGKVRIFSTDGKLMKSIGVVGDRVGIYDLPSGSYILSVTGNDRAMTASFLKK